MKRGRLLAVGILLQGHRGGLEQLTSRGKPNSLALCAAIDPYVRYLLLVSGLVVDGPNLNYTQHTIQGERSYCRWNSGFIRKL